MGHRSSSSHTAPEKYTARQSAWNDVHYLQQRLEQDHAAVCRHQFHDSKPRVGMTKDSSRPRSGWAEPSQILSSDAYCIPSWRGYLHLNSLNTKHKPAIRSDSAGRRRRSSLVLCYHDSIQSCESCKTVSTMNKHSLLLLSWLCITLSCTGSS